MNETEIRKKLVNLSEEYNYSLKYQVEVMGKQIDVPVKYSDASALTLFFPVSIDKTKEILNSKRLNPVAITPNKCLLAITFFNYHDSAVGHYHEFTFSVPVLVDSKFTCPILPIIFDSFFPNFGYNVILIGADTEISRAHIEKIFPYPAFKKDISIILDENDNKITASIKDKTGEVISVNLSVPNNYNFSKEKYNTYCTENEKVFRVQLNAFLYWEKIVKMNNFKINLGNHEISKIFRKLNMAPKPISGVYYKKAIEIASEPKEI
ncbi:MAG: hypothetical protein KAR00_03180 [Candidatus Pacebacteria bacterium]|nr:hypothetical protein [Candidatus Paceibacterota bacterium]